MAIAVKDPYADYVATSPAGSNSSVNAVKTSGTTGSNTGSNNSSSSTSTTSTSTSTSSSGTNNQYTRSSKVNNYYNTSKGYANEVDGSEFSPSDYLSGYKNTLSQVEANKPSAYQSKYTDTINGLLDSILNEKSFSYTGQDMMNDDMYKLYSDMYEKNARQSMQNAMGNAQAQTGGYGSTYSQAAGQQAYDETMSNMNDIALTLADKAYEKYLNERSNRYNKLNTVTGLDDTDYSRYRDTVGDWQTDRDYYAGRYNDTYNQEYGAYRDSVGDLQYLADYYAGLGNSESANELNAWKANEAANEFAQEYTLSQNADQRASAESELDNQIKQLQIQQLQKQLAGIGSGSGSGSGNGNGNQNTDLSEYTYAGLVKATNGGFTAQEFAERCKATKENYLNMVDLGLMTETQYEKMAKSIDATRDAYAKKYAQSQRNSTKSYSKSGYET